MACSQALSPTQYVFRVQRTLRVYRGMELRCKTRIAPLTEPRECRSSKIFKSAVFGSNALGRFSRPMDFARYGTRLPLAQNITVLLGADVMAIQL